MTIKKPTFKEWYDMTGPRTPAGELIAFNTLNYIMKVNIITEYNNFPDSIEVPE